LPRRLGDDPLTRARDEKARTARASASAASDSGGQGTAHIVKSSSRASYNNVFFERRAEGTSPQQRQVEDVRAPEVPEISEISEIPEIREVAAAAPVVAGPSLQADPEIAAEVNGRPEGAQENVLPAAPVSLIEEVVEKSNGTAAWTDAVKDVTGGEPARLQVSSQAPEISSEAPAPQKSGGFFKRLFGKFK
jgi:hypothetical protein